MKTCPRRTGTDQITYYLLLIRVFDCFTRLQTPWLRPSHRNLAKPIPAWCCISHKAESADPQQETPESDTMSLEVDIPFLLERLQVLQTDHKQTPQFHQYPTEIQDFWTGRWGLDFTCYGNADHRHGRVCWSCVGLVALVKASAPFPFIY